MRHPANYYIRCLICDGMNNADIKTELRYRNIFPIDDTGLEHIRRDVGTPPGALQLEVLNGDTQKWLRSRGVSIYFTQRDRMAPSEKLLITGRVRENIEKLMLAGCEAKEVLTALQNITNFSAYTLGDLKIYKHYFWNTDLLSQTQMLQFLAKSHGTDYYAEALTGGKERALSRIGIDTPSSPDAIHERLMKDLGLRGMAVGRLPISVETDRRVVAIARTYSQMWKNSKTVGQGELIEAYERLSRFTEKRNAPAIGSGSAGLLPSTDRSEEDDENLETDEFDTGEP